MKCFECFLCTAKFTLADSHYMVAVEKPYTNIWFCGDCLKQHTIDGLFEIIRNNYDKVKQLQYFYR